MVFGIFVALSLLAYAFSAPAVSDSFVAEISGTATGSDVDTAYTREENLNDGRWKCEWYLSGTECAEGKFTCSCPGDGQSVHFKIGCCYEWPRCGRICHKGTNCGRYANCASCRSGIGEWNRNSCNNCKPGFAIGVGDCQTDINECLSNNGGCEQQCHNTWGSYYCSCNDGHRLMANKHTCERLSCEHPGDISGGSVAPTAMWLYDSYAQYSCNSHALTLVGNSVRQCSGPGTDVQWTGSAPTCRDTCSAIASTDRITCGSPNISRDKCTQLGCCYNEASDVKCYYNSVLVYVKYAGERPTPSQGNGFFTQYDSTIEGCAYECVVDNAGKCMSFGVRHTGSDDTHHVDFRKCHLHETSRNEYSDSNQIRKDANYDLYDPLETDLKAVLYGAKLSSPEVLSKLYAGCFKEDPSAPDMEYLAFFSGSDMTIDTCIDSCRKHSFSFAGLHNGYECYCSDSPTRNHGEADDCSVPCTGDSSQLCGSDTSNAVYHVPFDTRYLGCYKDTSERDLPIKMWGRDAGRSASSCIEECASSGYKYAGVQEGGHCYCGSSYGMHGGAQERACNVRCSGWAFQNCGGVNASAIYTTDIPFDLNSGKVDHDATKAYDSSGKITGVSTRLFTMAPGLRSIVTNKLVVYSSETVQAPIEDTACADNCFQDCGDIYRPEELATGDSVTLRFFHFRISDLPKYVSDSTKKVFLYTQTLVIDQDVSVHHALLIRTRQLILDRTQAGTISVHSSAPELGVNVEDIKYNGPEPDMLFEKQSFMCARIMFETSTRANSRNAWAIVNGLSAYPGKSEEPAAFSASVRTYQAELAGIDRVGLRYVPFYTKAHISQILATYYERISIYRDEYNRMEDRTLSQKELMDVAEGLQKIYTDTDIAEAQNGYETSKTALGTSNATYYRMRDHYEVARKELEEARVKFEKGLKEHLAWSITKAVFSFVGSMAKVVFGIIDFDVTDLKNSVDGAVDDSQALVTCMQDVSYAVHQTEMLQKMAEDIFHKIDLSNNIHETAAYVDDVELMISMRVNLIQWENLKTYGNVMLLHDLIMKITGAQEYKRAFLDSANWGLAMTRSMLEKAELMRQSIDAKFLLQSKKRQQKRVMQVFADAEQAGEMTEQLMTAIIEQSYDVRMDLNEALMMFCQAYFYENLYECKASYKPSFGGDMTELLLKINSARRDELLISSAPSTASRIITITDTDMDADCSDAMKCPINYFRNHRVLYFVLPTNHSELQDLDKYKVSEIILNVPGAKHTSSSSYLKLRIESSGDFQSRAGGQVYSFITRPLSLAFEYDVISGHISLRADIYQPFRNIVNHITPYTTWVMQVSDTRSSGIDLSDVTSIRMRLDGSASDNGQFRQNTDILESS